MLLEAVKRVEERGEMESVLLIFTYMVIFLITLLRQQSKGFYTFTLLLTRWIMLDQLITLFYFIKNTRFLNANSVHIPRRITIRIKSRKCDYQSFCRQ